MSETILAPGPVVPGRERYLKRVERFRDGGGWEEAAGYSRAARRGRRVAVSGTTAEGKGAYEQAIAAIRRSIAAVEALGGRREDILRTRLYLAPAADWEGAGRAHAELLGDVAPANTTLHVAELIGGFLVEVEVEAELSDPA